MKVLQLVHGLSTGGAEVIVTQLARDLRARGSDVEIGCLDVVGALGEMLRREGIPVVHYDRRPGKDPSLPWRIAAHVRRAGIDLIHAHQMTCYVYAVVAQIFRRVPIVVTEHGRLLPDLPSRKRQVFNRMFAGSLARTIAVSQSVRRSLIDVEAFAPDSIEVLYNGVDLERFAGTERSGRECLGLPADSIVVGSIGRLDRGKNHQLLLRATAMLASEFPGLRLVIAGDGPERQALEALGRELGIGDRVHLLGDRRDVDSILPVFDVFTLPSLHEGTPLTLLEAMAASRPIVASAVGGIPEILEDGVDAILVPAETDDPSGLAAALRRLLGDPQLGAKLGAAARRRAATNHSLSVVLDRYQAIYLSSVEGVA